MKATQVQHKTCYTDANELPHTQTAQITFLNH